MDTKQIEYMLMIAEENNITAPLALHHPAPLNLQLLPWKRSWAPSCFTAPARIMASHRGRGNLSGKCAEDAADQAGHLPEDQRHGGG